MWTKVKIFLKRKKTLRQEAERAYGLWLATPRTTSATRFISNVTGIPREDVWDLIYGKKDS